MIESPGLILAEEQLFAQVYIPGARFHGAVLEVPLFVSEPFV
jgi:hypothetical protein